MTVYQHIPSSVLALEYLADVERFQGLTRYSSWEEVRPTLADCLEHGLGRNLQDWYSLDAKVAAEALAYVRSLLELNAQRQQAKRQRERAEAAARHRERAEAARVEAVKVVKPKPKPKRNDAAYNERRMRVALLGLASPKSGWVKEGIREVARRAGMPHRTARTVLDRMAADGQVALDRKWGQGNPTGVHPLLDHPAWSEHEYAQLGDKAL